MGVGVLGALAVEAFRTVLFALEMGLVGAHDGHLVPAARELEPEIRLLVPAIGGPAVGMLLWLAEGAHSTKPSRFTGDYIEAVAIGNGRLDLRGGLLKILASLVVVSTGGAVGRELSLADPLLRRRGLLEHGRRRTARLLHQPARIALFRAGA